MLVRDLFTLITGVTRVVDTSSGELDLRRHLMVPDEVPYAGADAAVTSDALVLCHLDQHAETLPGLPLGARALILCGWPVDAFPRDRVLRMLSDGHLRLTAAVPIEHSGRYGISVALVAERVSDVAVEAPGAGSTEARLWVANQVVLGDLMTLPLQRRADALGDRVNWMAADLAAARKDAEAARAELARARKRINALEKSVPERLARNVVRVWRQRRARTNAPKNPVPKSRTNAAADNRRTVTIPLPVAPPRALTMTAPAGLLVPRKLAKDGLAGYEPSTLPCFLAALDAAGPGAVLDIGANVGLYAALAAGVTGRDVIAFEPFPALAEVVERLSADNRLDIRVEPIALSDHTGRATFYLSDSSDSSNSLAAGFRESSRQIEVPVETLDAYVERTGIVPAVLKVDTESTEPDVLLGAAGTLREHRPWVLCEVLHGRGEDRLMEAMAPHGYRWYHITDELPYRDARVIRGDRTYRDLMWLFAPEEPDGSFWSAVAGHRAGLRGDLPLLVGRDHTDGDA